MVWSLGRQSYSTFVISFRSYGVYLCVYRCLCESLQWSSRDDLWATLGSHSGHGLSTATKLVYDDWYTYGLGQRLSLFPSVSGSRRPPLRHLLRTPIEKGVLAGAVVRNSNISLG